MLRFFTWIWLKFLDPVWNIFPAWIQSWSYDKKKGKDIYHMLRSLAPDIQKIQNHMNALGFEWTSDPLGGSLDYHSFAWVICARGKGDCDDWAHLWYRLLRHHGKVEKMYTRKKGGGAHAMTIFTKGNVCYLLSNLRLRTKVGVLDKKLLLTNFYGEETDFSIII